MRGIAFSSAPQKERTHPPKNSAISKLFSIIFSWEPLNGSNLGFSPFYIFYMDTLGYLEKRDIKDFSVCSGYNIIIII